MDECSSICSGSDHVFWVFGICFTIIGLILIFYKYILDSDNNTSGSVMIRNTS